MNLKLSNNKILWKFIIILFIIVTILLEIIWPGVPKYFTLILVIYLLIDAYKHLNAKFPNKKSIKFSSLSLILSFILGVIIFFGGPIIIKLLDYFYPCEFDPMSSIFSSCYDIGIVYTIFAMSIVFTLSFLTLITILIYNYFKKNN